MKELSVIACILSIISLFFSIVWMTEVKKDDYTLYMAMIMFSSIFLLGFSVLSTIHAFKKK